MKTSLLPATRIERSLRRAVEKALEEGETLSSFIESAVRRQLRLRESQRSFLARGLVAEARAEEADGWLSADDVLKEVRTVVRVAKKTRRRVS